MIETEPNQVIGGGLKLECFALTPTPPKLVPADPLRGWMDQFPGRHAYKCLPMAVANSYGWEILSPCRFAIDWTGGPESEAITFRALDDFPYLDHLVNTNFTRGIVTFHTGYMFRTAPGWHLLANGPFNRPKHGISPLSGVIETDWLPYPFTMNWQLTAPGTVVFEKDEPFCLVFPVGQGVLESAEPMIRNLDEEPALKEQYAAWRDHRGDFLKRLKAQDEAALKQAWQRYYFRGELPEAGIKAPASHTNKLRLKPPIDRRK